MAKLKELMIAHGEKIALGVIALLCLMSILGNVVRDPRAMELPDGKSVVIEIPEVDREITAVEASLASSTAVHPPRTVAPFARTIAHHALGRFAPPHQANWRWSLYVQPPEVTVPTPWKEQPVEIIQSNIPPEYRTRFGNPVDFTVRATPDGTVITVRDSDFLNYIEPGSRRYILLRKRVGFAQDELEPRILTALPRSPRTASLSGETEDSRSDRAAAATPAPATRRPFGFGTQRTEEKRDVVEASKTKTGPERTEYFRQIDAVNIRAFNDMRTIMDPGARMDTGWEILTDNMPALRESIRSDEIVPTILQKGVTHETTYLPKPEEETKEVPEETQPDAPPQVEEPPRTHNPWGEGPTILVRDREPKEKVKEEKLVDVGMRPDQLYTYVWLDTDTEQNMVYRYAVLCSVKPRNVPQAVLDEMELTGRFDIYAEINGMSPYGDFAPPESVVQPRLEAWLAQTTKGVGGDFRLEFEEAYPPEQEWESRTNPLARSLRDREGRLTDLGRAYMNQESCYSDVVYSDLVLIPVEQQISVVTAAAGAATIRVTVTTRDGKTQSHNFFVEVDPPVPPIQVTDWLEKTVDEQGNQSVKWPDYRILTPEEVYQTRLGTDSKRIGEVVRRGREETDFTSNWAVIDIRPFHFVRHTETVDREGNWTPRPSAPPTEQWCVIIREIDVPPGRRPRVRRLFRPISARDTERIREEIEYIFEPETVRFVEERKARDAARPGGLR